MDWKFLDVTMERTGFNRKRRGWISECLLSSMISVLVPFLFLMVAEGFNVMMVKSIQMKIFNEYEVGRGKLISRLKVNFNKSSLIGVNIHRSWLEEAVVALNCRVWTTPFKYLGLPVGGNHRRMGSWKSVVDTVWRRLSSWNNNNLSIGGHIILLKSV
ncbi:unnamed protein product [Vicia faba]|uniref:Uncharacterized protein n=1 Tax=Vicia faba TaxID=3906 RepID=A0AAV1B598_VICFA|nr:unnamed protein product [Vicia faba]